MEAHRWAHYDSPASRPCPPWATTSLSACSIRRPAARLPSRSSCRPSGDIAIGGFQECTGLDLSLTIEDVREGGRNSEVLHFPTRSEWGQITLKKGVGALTSLWDWSYSFVEGKGKRRDGLVILLTDLHIPNNIWYFRRGLPRSTRARR